MTAGGSATRPAAIRVGGRPPVFSGVGTFFDGRSSDARPASLTVDEAGAALVVTMPDAEARRWPLADVRRLPDHAGPGDMVLALLGDPVSRLVIDDPVVARIVVARCPRLNWRPKARGLGRVAVWAVASVASVALIVAVLIPAVSNRLAAVMPGKGEAALGDATLVQVRRALADGMGDIVPLCAAPDGLEALDAMTARLSDGLTLPADLSVAVLDIGDVNAFALPGGHIVLFRGLIDAAQSPDEVAAVLAHELGHVAARDPVRIALRSAGSVGVLGLLLGDFAGGAVVLFLTERLIRANYGQEAERAADAFAVERLDAAGIDAGALATFFERMQEMSGTPPALLRHFLVHPELAARIEAARGGDAGATRPALAAAEWAGLKTICD